MQEHKLVLENIAKNKGLITVNEAEKNQMTRFQLSSLVRTNTLERVKHGVYMLKSEIVDEYALMQISSKKLIYSYHTALYFHGLSDRVPSQIHMTVPQGYNASRLKSRHDNLVIHYVKKEVFDLGKTNKISPMGGEIVLYDVERCLCDLIKDRNKIDSQIFTGAIQSYFKGDNANTRKLIRYAKEMNVEKEVRKYIEVLI